MNMDKANLRMYIVSDSFKNVAVTNLFTLLNDLAIFLTNFYVKIDFTQKSDYHSSKFKNIKKLSFLIDKWILGK